MSHVDQLLNELHRRGISLALNGDRLRVSAPRGTLSAAIRDELAKHKPDLLRALRANAATTDQPFAGIGKERVRIVGDVRYVDGSMDFGDVCWGWSPHAWITELRRKADRCDRYRPDMATYFRAWADALEARTRDAKERQQ